MPDGLPRATIRRLPRYLRALDVAGDRANISSDELARAAYTNAAIVRRDLNLLGFSGVRGVGYDVARLRSHNRAGLGRTDDVRMGVVGPGNLGPVLANYGAFRRRGIRVVAPHDREPREGG